ncbi:MAG: cytochrome c oxidase subunit 3 [Celeribacter sp.]
MRKDLIAGLAIGVGFGAVFTMFQAYEYYELLVHEGWTFGGDVFFGGFFMATGFHGFHVLVGTIFLTICLVRSIKGDFTPDDHIGFEAAAWYWHFVDVVWLFLFVAVYIWGQ